MYQSAEEPNFSPILLLHISHSEQLSLWLC